MTEAIAARTRGDDYQARVFWLHASRLFQAHSAVEEVAFDDPELRYFDDVSLYYNRPIPDERGETIFADHYQVKFHVDGAGCLNWESFMDPKFVGARNLSLLERVRDFRRAYLSPKVPFRLYFVSPWDVDSSDPLSKLVSNQGGEIRFNVLFDGSSDRTVMGQVRSSWREHLDLDDGGLRETLTPLRIVPRFFDLKTLSELVNIRLANVGLMPVGDHSQANVYDDLIKKMHQAGRIRFTRDQLRQICEQEGLWEGTPRLDPRVETYGIRSFMRWAEHMEDETNRLLCLVRYFDNREIRMPELWNEQVLPEIRRFLEEMKPGRSHCLLLDAHTSICFAAGYFLPQKSGIDVSVAQRTQGKRIVWTPKPIESADAQAVWSMRQEMLSSSGAEVAVAVSVTHEVFSDVAEYVKSSLPQVGRILEFSVLPGPGQSSVRNVDHALSLAQSLSSSLKVQRTPSERREPMHLFVAAPAGFTFFLGQLGRSFGPTIMYEYAFETNAPGAYRPGIRLAFGNS